MKSLFDPISFGSLTLKNRLVRSATLEGCSDEVGMPSAEMGRVWADLAKGGLGLIISGMVGVCENSCVSERMIRAYASGLVEAFKPFIETVHQNGAKFAVQLGHCGVKATFLESSAAPLGPSVVELPRLQPPQAMSRDDIAKVVEGYGLSARLCRAAGADAVQLHAAHGYLLSQFLSPFFNQRQDEYGGSIENRSRILVEIMQSINEQAGADFPVLIKINYNDLTEPSISFEECAHVCARLISMGLCAVELSAGLGNDALTSPVRRVKGPEEESYFAEPALDLADILPVPVISVGGYRDPANLEKRLNQGNIAAIAMSRPLICQPDLPVRWQRGERERALCISCNRCFSPKGLFGCKYSFSA